MKKCSLEQAIVLSLVVTSLGGSSALAAGPIYETAAGEHNYEAANSDTLQATAFGGYGPEGAMYGVADAAIAGKGSGVKLNLNNGVTVNLDSTDNAGSNDAHGIGAYDGSTITVNGGGVTINNAASHTQYDNHGVVAGQDSKITINADTANITLSNGHHNSGLRVYKNGSITVTSPLTMNITAGTTGGAGSAMGITVNTHQGVPADVGSIETGAVTMTLTGSNIYGSQAIGVAVAGGGSYKATGNLDITATGTTDSGRFAGIQNTGGGNVTVEDVKIIAKTTGSGEAYGVLNTGTGSYTGKNLDITAASNGAMVMGISNICLNTDGAAKIDTGDIIMDLQGAGSEVYGILNGNHLSGADDAVAFKSGAISIIANNTNGNLISIANKAGSTFVADGDITIEGSGKGYVVGIENQTGNVIGMENVNIKLRQITGSGKIIGISTPYAALQSKNATIVLENQAGTGATTGIDVGGNTANIDEDLFVDIEGNAATDTKGVNGNTNVIGNAVIIINSGKNITGIAGTADIGGNLHMQLTDSLGDSTGINGKADIDGNATIVMTGSGSVIGINGQATIGEGGLDMNLSGTGGSLVTGIATGDAAKEVKVDGNVMIDIHDSQAGSRIAGVTATTNDATKITIGGLQNYISVEGASEFVEGLFAGVDLAANSVTDIKVKNTVASAWQTHGIYDRDSKGVKLGANAVLNIDVDTRGVEDSGAAGWSEGTFGLLVNGTQEQNVLEAGSKLNITVQGNAATEAGMLGAVGIAGSLQAAGDVNVNVKSEGGIGLRVTAANDTIDYTGDVVVTTNHGIAIGGVGYNNGASSLTIDPVSGKKVQLTGDIKQFTTYGAAGKLNLDVSFKTADSFFTGASVYASTANDDRTTNLLFDNASRWNMTGDSVATALTNQNNATVDMTKGAAKLNVSKYTGTGGNLIMDTDLASETDGDKINIGTTTAVGTTYVQVWDASLKTHNIVTGVKNLLLITDNSSEKAAIFTGKKLNMGGLWDMTPTIKNGLEALDANGNSVGTANQWYLTKVKKQVNNDTSVLLQAGDNAYALWRNTNDTLRKRLGDLRYRTDKTAGDGIWARYTGGKFGGSGLDSS